jgi:hypothetical protein
MVCSLYWHTLRICPWKQAGPHLLARGLSTLRKHVLYARRPEMYTCALPKQLVLWRVPLEASLDAHAAPMAILRSWRVGLLLASRSQLRSHIHHIQQHGPSQPSAGASSACRRARYICCAIGAQQRPRLHARPLRQCKNHKQITSFSHTPEDPRSR